MKDSDRTSIIYFTIVVLLSVILSTALILHLEWPASAEIPLCLSIFIQMTAIAKSLQHMIQETGAESLPEVFTMLKEGTLDQNSAN